MAVGRVGDRAAGSEGAAARGRAGHRRDAPLRQPRPDRPGDRGLGRLHRDDPRRHPRRRPGQPVRCRDLSLTRARRLILAAIRSGRASYKALTRQIAGYRTVTGRDRHRARKSKSPSTFSHAGPKDTVTRTAPAVITLANKPARTAETPPPNRPASPRKPACRRPSRQLPPCPANGDCATSPKRKPPIKA